MTEHGEVLPVRDATGERPGTTCPGSSSRSPCPGIGEAPISITSSPTRDERRDLRDGGPQGRQRDRRPAPAGAGRPGRDPRPLRHRTSRWTTAMKGKDLLFICGGIGLVPVRSAIHYVLDHREDYGEVTILFGTRTPAERLFIGRARRAGRRARTSRSWRRWTWPTSPGAATWASSPPSCPQLHVDPAERRWPSSAARRSCTSSCCSSCTSCRSPTDHIYVSLERHMKCGVGQVRPLPDQRPATPARTGRSSSTPTSRTVREAI